MSLILLLPEGDRFTAGWQFAEGWSRGRSTPGSPKSPFPHHCLGKRHGQCP